MKYSDHVSAHHHHAPAQRQTPILRAMSKA
jgi:hypothetical protein